jgi:hypothetical protein
VCKLADEAALAGTRFTADERNPATLALRAGYECREARKLPPAADERR